MHVERKEVGGRGELCDSVRSNMDPDTGSIQRERNGSRGIASRKYMGENSILRSAKPIFHIVKRECVEEGRSTVIGDKFSVVGNKNNVLNSENSRGMLGA